MLCVGRGHLAFASRSNLDRLQGSTGGAYTYILLVPPLLAEKGAPLFAKLAFSSETVQLSGRPVSEKNEWSPRRVQLW